MGGVGIGFVLVRRFSEFSGDINFEIQRFPERLQLPTRRAI